MERYALLSPPDTNDVYTVDTVITSAEAPAPELGDWVPCGNAGPGFTTADRETFDPPAVAPTPRHITRLAFLSRFTDAEAIAIDLASIGATVEAAAMRRYMSKVEASTYIDLDRVDTRDGVEAMEAGGFLAAGRAAEILDAPVADAERYKG